MLMRRMQGQRGGTLLEVLVALLITSFGLLALAGLQTRMNSAVMESYQRAQALTLMEDMANRLQLNADNAASYSAGGTDTPLGTDETAACIAVAGAATPTRAQRDLCDWSRQLQGASETSGGSAVGAMIGARGCVEQITAADANPGVCQPGIYRVTVSWQGLTSTVAPTNACGKDQYGDDTLRKSMSTQVYVPLPSCS